MNADESWRGTSAGVVVATDVSTTSAEETVSVMGGVLADESTAGVVVATVESTGGVSTG